MNKCILRQLLRALSSFNLTPHQKTDYARKLLIKHLFPTQPWKENIPTGIINNVEKILCRYSLKPDGTPQAFTPEILSLLRESSLNTRKKQGVFFTPWELGTKLATETLDALESLHGPLSASQLFALKILDPAAGAGGLLLPFAVELTRRICLRSHTSSATVLRHVLQSQLYAVDIDAGALEDYRLRASLLGGNKHLSMHTCVVNSLHHFRQRSILEKIFKEVITTQKGFDIILANPPYVGQKNNAMLFNELRKNPLWKDKITPKGDLHYLFFYLALRLLRPGAVAGFITPPYFTTAAGALSLRDHLQKNVSFLRLINFEDKNLFPDTSNHTLLSVFTKGKINSPCILGPHQIQILQSSLYEGKNNFLCTHSPDPDTPHLLSILQKMQQSPYTLGEIAHISNGLMTGCDRLSATHLNKFKLPGLKKGMGVFVLSDKEKKEFSLSPTEKKKIKPFFKNSDISPFLPNYKNRYWLIDLFYPNDREINIKHYPHLLAHLTRFRPVLLARKQNNNGIQHQLKRGVFWFASVRRKMDFEGEKLVIPQRAIRPCFAYAPGPWYASSDVYFISKSKKDISLLALLSLLNSPLYHLWLYYKGKRKGALLELYAQPLNNLPIPDIDANTRHNLETLVRRILTLKHSNLKTDSSSLEKQIFLHACGLFHLTPQEIHSLWNWHQKYSKKILPIK